MMGRIERRESTLPEVSRTAEIRVYLRTQDGTISRILAVAQNHRGNCAPFGPCASGGKPPEALAAANDFIGTPLMKK